MVGRSEQSRGIFFGRAGIFTGTNIQLFDGVIDDFFGGVIFLCPLMSTIPSPISLLGPGTKWQI